MSLQALVLQFAFLYAPLLHCPTEEVTPNLYRGPDPKKDYIYALHDQGIKTIISLRTNPEHQKQKLCEKLGMQWINIKTGVFMTPSDEQFDQFRSIVNAPEKQPCYISCEVDMDRTGVYLATYRMVDQQWTAQQMEQEFSEHHKKKWWPIFRKYERVVIAYAEKRRKASDSGESDLSSRAKSALQADARQN